MTHDEKINTIKSLIRENGNKFITVDFIKKSGELRHMQCHRSKVLESSVKGTAPEATASRKATLKANNMLCVEELVKPGTNEFQWRTINCETVKKIACNGVEYIFD